MYELPYQFPGIRKLTLVLEFRSMKTCLCDKNVSTRSTCDVFQIFTIIGWHRLALAGIGDHRQHMGVLQVRGCSALWTKNAHKMLKFSLGSEIKEYFVNEKESNEYN